VPEAAKAAKPYLVRLLEELASVLGLDHGRQRLELIYVDGHLESWWRHEERRPPHELAAYEGRGCWLLEPGAPS